MKLHALFSSGLSALNAQDGWVLVAPFGEFPFRDAQGRQHVQVFNAENCAAMVTTFNSLWSKLSRVVGSMFGGHACPLWLGHPDFAPQIWPKREQLGTIEGLRLTDRGMEALLAYNAAGEAVKAAGRHIYPSVSVECEPDAAGRIHPQLLWSVGLWEKPNIPAVDSILAVNAVNEDNEATPSPEPEPEPNEPETMKLTPQLKALLVALGVMPADAPDDMPEDGINAALSEGVTACDAMKQKITDAETSKAAAETAVTASNAQAATHTATIAALRLQRAELAVDGLIASGRIAEADRAATLTALNSEAFAEELAKLKTKPPVGNNAPLKLGEKRGSITTINAARETIANWCAKQGGDYQTAFNASKAADECKAAWAIINKADEGRASA